MSQHKEAFLEKCAEFYDLVNSASNFDYYRQYTLDAPTVATTVQGVLETHLQELKKGLDDPEDDKAAKAASDAVGFYTTAITALEAMAYWNGFVRDSLDSEVTT